MPHQQGEERSSTAPARRVGGLLVAPAALFVIDAFVLNQGALAALVAVVALLIGVPAALCHGIGRREWSGARRHALRALFFALAAVAVILVNRAQNDLARGRAGAIIAACEAFQGRHARYPATLAELVPEFLSSVPRAKYTLGFSEFSYVMRPDGPPTLFYVSLPPFGRPVYSFAGTHGDSSIDGPTWCGMAPQGGGEVAVGANGGGGGLAEVRIRHVMSTRQEACQRRSLDHRGWSS
jgi:hypothetical protein